METLLAMQTGQPAPELSGWEVADCCVNVYHQSIYPGYNCFINTGGLCTQAAYNSSRGKCENDTCQAVVKVRVVDWGKGEGSEFCDGYVVLYNSSNIYITKVKEGRSEILKQCPYIFLCFCYIINNYRGKWC